MAVKLSRQPGLFSVLLSKVQWLDVGLLAPTLASALRVTRSDAVRMLRLQKGILCEGLAADRAEAAAAELGQTGVACRVVPDAEVPVLSKPIELSLIRISETHFETPALVGAGLPQLWAWENLTLVCAGIILDAKAQAEKLTSGIEKGVHVEAEVRKAHAARQLEKVRERVFPLSSEIRREEPALGEALTAAARAKQVSRKKRPETAAPNTEGGEFGTVRTVIDLVFTQPLERLRVTEKTRVQDHARSAHPVKQLHSLMAALMPLAGSKRMSDAAGALAAGRDAGEYLFEDLHQFDDYCRWCYFKSALGA